MNEENSQVEKDDREPNGVWHLPYPLKNLKPYNSHLLEPNHLLNESIHQSCKIDEDDFSEHQSPKVQKTNLCNNQRGLNLYRRQLGWEEMECLLRDCNCLKNLQILDLTQNDLQDKGVWILFEDHNSWKHLKMLNLAENHFRISGAKALSFNLKPRTLKTLNLSGNPIGDEGIKHLSEGSSWVELEVLILNNVSLDYYGVKILVANESWKSLQELYLQDNPLIGDLGVEWLSCHTQWKRLQRIFLQNSNIRDFSTKNFGHNRVWKSFCCSNNKMTRSEERNYQCHRQLEEEERSSSILSRKQNTAILLYGRVRSRGGSGNPGKKTGEIKNQGLNRITRQDK